MSAESPCENQLRDAIICVEGNDVCTPCFEPNDGSFADEFPQDAENTFRKTLAFIPPQQSGFCMEANYRVCEGQEESMYCCCEEEIEAYFQCSFDSVWVAKFGVIEPCQYKGCGVDAAGGGGGGNSSNNMIYIIVGACVGAILLFCGLLYWRFQRMKAAKIAASKKKASKADKGKDKKSVKKDARHKAHSKSKRHLRDVEAGYDDDDDSSIDDSDHRSRKSSKSKHHKDTKTKGKSTQRLSGMDDSESTSGRSRSHKMKKSSSSESTWSVDSEGNSKNSKKNKKIKAEDAEKERLRAEREAKIARSEKRISTRKLKMVEAELGAELAVTEAEKKAMAKKMKKMERERLAMAEQIAELEAQNTREAMLTDIGLMQDPHHMMSGNSMLVQPYGGMTMNLQQQQPPMAGYYGGDMPIDQSMNSQAIFPPVNMVAINNEETVDDFVTLPPDLEDDKPAGWLGHEISRRAESQFTPHYEYGMADPDGNVDVSFRRRPLDSSSHSQSKLKSRSRSRSNERMDGAPRKPRSLENLSIGENEDYSHPMPQRGLTRTYSERRKPRSLENLAVDQDDYNVPTRGLSRTVSERHSRSMRNSSRMVDHTGHVADSWSKSDHVRSMNSSGHSASGRHRSRSKDALDRKAPARSKSESVRKPRSSVKRTNSGEKLHPTTRN